MIIRGIQRLCFAFSVVALTAFLSACGGSKPSSVGTGTDAAASSSSAAAVEAPQLTEKQAEAKATDLKTDALTLEDTNHVLRQEIYETKVKLGMDADSGLPETSAAKVAAPVADTTAAAPATSKKKKKSK